MTFVNATSASFSGSTESSQAIDIPAGAAVGDRLIVGALGTGTGHTAMTAAVGGQAMTQLAPASGVGQAGSSARFASWWRTLTADDLTAGTALVTSDATGRWTAVAVVDTGGTAEPVADSVGLASSGTTLDSLAVTPPVGSEGGTVIHLGFCTASSGGQITGTGIGDVSIHEQVSNNAGSGSNGASMVATSEYVGDAPVPGAPAITLSESSGSRGVVTVLLSGPISEPEPEPEELAFASATGGNPVGGTTLEVISDDDDGTVVWSGDNPDGEQWPPWVLPPIEPPAGDWTSPFRTTSTGGSGTIAFEISGDGTTWTPGPTIVCDGAPADRPVVFPAASLTGITEQQWATGVQVRLTLTAD